eukprot:TRINITY_DN20338_c0_g1_i1.p1 TRINITY_DN20338_c0_g1~~TRINITY_DN20338_c0_g1_i1.p1  ORF type:complete len:547 (+),score=155.79 TRINITY_DN20338_c0_g1_i1:88-1641(+)
MRHPMRCPAVLLCTVLLLTCSSHATPLDDYINKDDGMFEWHDTQARVHTLLGSTAYVLNVTSQQWLDVSKAHGPNGALWMHQAVVVVPKTLRIRDRAAIYVTGGCNDHPKVPPQTDTDLLLADTIAEGAGIVTVVLYQIPNCHVVFPSDPNLKPRGEDAFMAWAWRQYIVGNATNPEWLPWLPMAKAVFKAMHASELFARQQGLAEIDGWVVMGASKRGWTSWAVGYADCHQEWCPTLVGLGLIVPIAPAISLDMHHQWQCYGGWTFAFKDYYEANVTGWLDSPQFDASMQIMDPINNAARLARLPKHVVVSSDDEFMMFEWTRLWDGRIPGETSLTIVDNAEHSMVTGLPEALETLTNFVRSVALNGTRPSIDVKMDYESGTITVDVGQQEHGKVVLRHAGTISTERRDFRWLRLADNVTSPCRLPEIPLQNPVDGGNCLVPVAWLGSTLEPVSAGRYVAEVPYRKEGWTGFYVEVHFPSDTGIAVGYQVTTPGMVWPQTYPFADCHGEGCRGTLV